MASSGKVVTPPADPQYRVQKGDGAYLAQTLEGMGYKVVHLYGRISAYDRATQEFVCGFTWRKATGTLPGRWTFDMNATDIFSLKDLKTVLNEHRRLRRLRGLAQTAWVEFLDSKSEKRWGAYLGILLAMFAPRAQPAKEPSNE